MRKLRTLLCLLLSVARAGAVVSEDTLPVADWISTGALSDGPQTVFFRKQFTAPAGLVKAVVLGACDQRMVVMLNGEPVAELAGYERADSKDVSQHVRPGQNVLTVRVDNDRGPAALRLMLELATDRGRQSWVVSDASWVTSLTKTGWRTAFAHGAAGLKRWGDAFSATKSIDAYNSWMLAKGAARATDPATIAAPPGFRVELLRSAESDEGSWIALAFDPQGRLTIAREQSGLLRFSFGPNGIQKPELIEDTLFECRGLLYAHGALYVNANNSKGFYRLRDTDGDGSFDEKLLLLETPGGLGHGRNQLRLGPDGSIYLVHGNDVELPANVAKDSPLKDFAADQLFPERWGEQAGSALVRPPHGHVLVTDRDGKTWRLMAGGLRNAMDVAFNEEGEMFTYDADNERDLGAPWYKPTRVLHLVPGGEYGWRPGAGKWPAYLPDTLPSVVDIGIGSPCGIEFGTRGRFPGKWRRALFIAEWAYGRILAVTLDARGASYTGTAEPFLSGRPLNVTDLTFGADGAMYFVTGGRGTRSGLYRVTFTGALEDDQPSVREEKTSELRALRKRLETLDDVAAIWPHLGHPDHFIRYAARVAIERQPVERWRKNALDEQDPDILLNALLAVARVGPKELQPRVFSRLQEVDFVSLAQPQRLSAVRVYEVSCTRMGRPPPEIAQEIAAKLDSIYPAETDSLNRELCRLLVYLKSPQAVAKTTSLLGSVHSSADVLHYLFHLRYLPEGWSVEERRRAFAALRRAEKTQGARDYLDALRLVRRELTAAVDPNQRDLLVDLLAADPVAPPPDTVDRSKYKFIKEWTLTDFSAADLARQGEVSEGREAFTVAQCIRCHRAAGEVGVSFGPDLTGIAGRFGRRELLEQILAPSKVIDEKFRNFVVTLKDGSVFVGGIEREDDAHLALVAGVDGNEAMEIAKSEIAERQLSDQSPMPTGLLNYFTKQQIVDLLAYLESGSGPGETRKAEP